MRYAKVSIIMLLVLALAALIGCGSANKESGASGATGSSTVATVSETLCTTCHSSTLEGLTGDPVVADYIASVHNMNAVGCQECHGGGAQHNGVGPIPYPSPSYVQCSKCHDAKKLATNFGASKHWNVQIENEANESCQRCHTHQGAVLAAKFGFTGDKTVMAALVNAPGLITNPKPIQCNTCHAPTHNPSKGLRVDAGWLPSSVVGSVVTSTNNEFRLCTQCHTFINPDGKLVATESTTLNTAAYEHDSSWYRVIASTHYDDPTTAGIEGYGVRTTAAHPCYDCHGHEAKANTGNLTRNAARQYIKQDQDPTIYTEWGQSGHAAKILSAKYASQDAYPKKSDGTYDKTAGMTVSVMAATAEFAKWNNHNSTSCNRCHTASGFVALLSTPAGTAQPTLSMGQVLTCWACHSDPSIGVLRTLAGTKANTNYTTDLGWNPTTIFLASGSAYSLNYGKKAYPDVAASNICITCHDSREKDPGAITDASTNYQRTHYLQAATTMYVKMGFITFGTGTEPISSSPTDTSLMSSQDGGAITSYHRLLGTPGIIGFDGITAADTGLTTKGPCVTCHFASGNHTQEFDQRTITAVCNRCHTAELGQDITTIANFKQYFLEPQSEVYQDALLLAITTFNDLNTGITLTYEPNVPERKYVRAYKTLTPGTEAGAADWTAAMTVLGTGYNQQKVMGAVSNIVYLKREPGAYAHARTYSRRLIYDTIDYIDNGLMDKSVSATALAKSAVVGSPLNGVYAKGTAAFTGDVENPATRLATGTSEAMTFLLKYSRSTGAWSTPERP